MSVNVRGSLARLRSGGDLLTKSDRLIAETILQDPHWMILASIGEIAERSRTSEAAVSRLVRRLGFRSFPEFRVALAQDLADGLEDINEDIAIDDDVGAIKRKTIAYNIRTLRDTSAVLTTESLASAIDALWAAERIAFMGIGGSGIVARDAYHKFFRTGRAVLALTDPHEQAMFAALSGPRDVLVFISHSGATRDLNDTARVAKERGARIIAITHFGKPPLARLADVHLTTSSSETRYRPEALSSRIATLSILDILYIGFAVRMDRQLVENLEAMRAVLASRRV